jgi:3-hydroxybutyryl-CoA dehydratase
VDDPDAQGADVSGAAWAPFPAVTHVIGPAQIERYAELSGDYNPLHMDAEFARSAGFDDVIAHGPIGLQTVFAAVARWLGADGLPPSVRIDVLYRGPVRVGDVITCRAEAIEDHAGAVLVRARCRDRGGREVLQALVVVPRHLVPREA